jgi:hypothetical protein
MQKNKTLLGIPTNRMVQPQTVLSLMKMVQHTKEDLVIVMAVNGYTVAENRNYIVTQAIKEKCSHVLMIDDDMTFPEDTLDRLMSHDKDFVGVVAHSRTLPALPVVTLFNQDELSTADRLLGRQELPKELFKAKGVGGSVLLLKTSIFNKIRRPWFANETYETGMTKTGEDYYFVMKCIEANIDIWVDPTLSIGHIGNYIF